MINFKNVTIIDEKEIKYIQRVNETSNVYMENGFVFDAGEDFKVASGKLKQAIKNQKDIQPIQNENDEKLAKAEYLLANACRAINEVFTANDIHAYRWLFDEMHRFRSELELKNKNGDQ